MGFRAFLRDRGFVKRVNGLDLENSESGNNTSRHPEDKSLVGSKHDRTPVSRCSSDKVLC